MPEETDVRRGGGADAPVEFRWNGQLHRVRVILSHHRIRSSPAIPPPVPFRSLGNELDDRRAARATDRTPSPEESEETDLTSLPAPVAPAEPPATSPDPPEPGERWHNQEVWRVRASPAAARLASTFSGVFDLRFDWSVGRWTVTRIDILKEEKP